MVRAKSRCRTGAFPPNPLPTTAPYYAHIVTDYSVETLPGVKTALEEAYSVIGWPGIVFFGVPQPGPGVPVYPEHINQLREVLIWW